MTTSSRPDLSDIRRGDWVDGRLPATWRPYTRLARLDRPIGIWLTLFPCWAALVQVSHGLPDLRQLVIKSTAVLFGRHGKIWISFFYVLTVGAWSVGGWLLGMSLPYAMGMLVIAVHLAWQIQRIDLARPEVNFRLFLANILTGALLACTAFAGTW